MVVQDEEKRLLDENERLRKELWLAVQALIDSGKWSEADFKALGLSEESY
jgi:hypothetical protein